MATRQTRVGERRRPTAAAVLLTGALRITLPPQLRLNDAGPALFVVLLGLVIVLILADRGPAFLFPEMLNPEHVRKGWCPAFVDYLHLSVNTAMAFSPTDVSAIKPWTKLTMMAEEMISVAVGILVVARAVNILK
jgi:hypothetical protein